MIYGIERTTKFKRDFKVAKKRGLDIGLLLRVIEILASGERLPAEYSDHPLSGNYNGCRECHIQPDWLLVYKRSDELLIISLERTGTHSDLFN